MEPQTDDVRPRPAGWEALPPARPGAPRGEQPRVEEAHVEEPRVEEWRGEEPWLAGLVAWPGEAERRQRLAAAGQPRLLVIAGDEAPPLPLDELEDWVREPCDPQEAAARWRTLEHRRRDRAGDLRLDDAGLLRFGGAWVALSAIEEATAVPIVARAGWAVPMAAVRDAYRAAGGSTAVGMPAPIARIRRKAERLGLRLHVLANGTVLLELPSPSRSPQTVHEAAPLEKSLRNIHAET
jgi:hypothetical protein